MVLISGEDGAIEWWEVVMMSEDGVLMSGGMW